MADKGTKIVMEIIKTLENRITKIEKELKSQQELVKKLVLCISELTTIIKTLPEKEIRKLMAFKYPLVTQEIKLDLSILEDLSTKLLKPEEKIDQVSELAVSENEEFSLSFDTLEILDIL
jgi:hypothetical protein